MILTPQEIIKKSLKEFKLQSVSSKREEVIKYLDYYTGTETQKYIKNFFDTDAFREIPCYQANFTRRFINKMSRWVSLFAKKLQTPVKNTRSHESPKQMKQTYVW